jgi:hypothetical protein
MRDGDVHNFCAQISGGTLGSPSMTFVVLGGIRAARHASGCDVAFLRGAHNMYVGARPCDVRDGDGHNFCAQISGGTLRLGTRPMPHDSLRGIRAARHASGCDVAFLRGAQNICMHVGRCNLRDGDGHNF